MEKSRPVLVLLISIAQMLLGISLLFCGGFSLIGNVAGSSAAEITIREGNKTTTRVYDTREEMEREAPGYKNFMLANGVAGVALSLAMLVGSLGLLWTKAWSW